ncbi:MAG: hypothetical protein IJ727_07390 [Treponema sp.]|nr:hypothetical protein [Treponema sp.]
MKKGLKKLFIILSLVMSVSLAFSLGKRDAEYRDVTEMDSWQETFDINEKKEGKYNIYVEAKDKGGNKEVAGPYNLFIDPDSDYAISGITNPSENMRVPGNLNIVGTCVDDDAVSEVWLILDGGEPVKAEGKEFWSYYLDTNDLAEGPHTIEVWGVDINGLSSQEKPKKKAFVTWNLDRRKPITVVTNHSLGELVSGKINLQGTISDGNGIKALYYSLDNGETYVETKVNFNKKDGSYTFDFPVNTKLAKDGPAILWFKAIDKMGSVGISSFLYFIDNTKPDVNIVSPKELEVCNGKFVVAGYAKDKVGIHKLSWTFNGQTEEFELVPGNPYWYKELDTIGMSGKNVDFTITAQDIAGNVVVVKKLIPINQEDDKPVVSIDYPLEGGVISGKANSLFVRGIVSDDDAVTSVEYSLDGGSALTVDSEGVFNASFEHEDLPAGPHKITVTATDINGVKGNPVTVNFISMGPLPNFSEANVNGTPCKNGLLVHPEANPVYEVLVSCPAGIVSYNYKIESGLNNVFASEEFTPKAPEESIGVKIPLADAPWGLVLVTVSAKDIYDRIVEKKSLINIKDLTYIHKDALKSAFDDLLFEGNDNSGISVEIVSINGAEYTKGMDVVVPYGPVSNSVAVFNVNVENSEKLPSVSYQIEGENEVGGDVVQKGKAELVGEHYEVKLANLPSRVTTLTVMASEGKVATGSCKVSFSVVRPVPDKRSDWKEGQVVFIPNENAVYDNSLNAYVIESGAEFTGYANISFLDSLAVSNADFELVSEEKSFGIKGLKDGIYKNIAVTAKDKDGKEYTSELVNLVVDSQAPLVEILSPANHLWVQEETSLKVNVSDANGISKVEYSLDGGQSWSIMKVNGSEYSANLIVRNFEDGLIGVDVRATDVTGKSTTRNISIQKDTTPPAVEIILPGNEDIVNGENLIAFMVKDNGKLASVKYIGPSEHGKSPEPIDVPLAPMITTHVGTKEMPISDLMSFKFSDAIGNSTEIKQWDFIIDNVSDLPIAEVHVPEENAVITRDFEFSGVIYDDDGVKKDDFGEVVAGPRIFYKFDNGNYEPLDQIGTSFIIPKKLTDFTDNEHSITIYAEDINGVKGPEFTRNFKISLEEPKGAVLTPPISETVKRTITMTGSATDKNGIKAVYISVDNGNSYNEALGNYGHEMTQCNWSYEFDTRVVEDGTHVVFMKVVDWYGIEGLYSSLINIDNTAPKIELMLPLDDSKTTGMLFLSGQTMDNIELKKLFITIRSLEGKVVNSSLARTDLIPDEIITQAMDISNLENGFYNIELTGVDAAENVTRVSRNIQLTKEAPKAKVDLLYPLNGEYVQGLFNIYGTAVSESDILSLTLFVDDKSVTQTELSESGYFKFTLDQTMIEEGQHKIRVEAYLADNSKIVSNTQYLNYRAVGPWITIDNFTYGDFAFNRPYIIGNAGYSYDEDEVVQANAKGAPKELKEAVAAKSVDKVELSLDNGKTFTKVSSSGKWRYRVENEDIAEGYHFLLVRATMKNGEIAVTRCIVQVDSTKPTIKLISPGAGGHYNQQMEFSGLARDDVALKSLTLALRSGDKAMYEIPGFIQGLYFDWQFWGATLFNVGAGLTFFDDNVKLQVQWGQFTQQQRELFDDSNMRYGGDNIFGVKLLANLYYMPFRYYFGPDWEWLSLNVAVGANFTRFNQSGSGKAQILSAGLLQLEFPRVTFSRQKMFRTIAFYTEGQLWFIPTDVQSMENIKSIVPQISFGLRVNVF